MFCEVISVYAASGDGFVGELSSVKSRAIVLRSSRIRAGLSTVPPDFTDVRILVSSARSSVTFFRRSSGSIWLSSRFLRIASFLFLLILYNNRDVADHGFYFNFYHWHCNLFRLLHHEGGGTDCN